MSLWKDKASGTYKYRFEVNKVPYCGGGFKTKAEANADRAEKRKRVLAGELSRPSATTPQTDMEFSRLLEAYLDASQRRHAVKTYKYKRFVYAGFLAHVGQDIPVNKITPFLIQDYLKTRESNSNYNRHRKDLGALFEYARKVLGIVQVNPCDVIEKLPEERVSKRMPTQEEFIKLITQADDDERPLLLVLAFTGARIDEALRLKWEDVNFENGFIRLWTRKTKDGAYRPREIPMRGFMKSFMLDLWEKRDQDVWVFWNVKTETRFIHRPRLMESLCRRVGIPRYGFHSIRHFVSSYLLDKEKIGKSTVGNILGHQSFSTTDIYAHSIGVHSADDAMDTAMDKLEAAFVPKLLGPGDRA